MQLYFIGAMFLLVMAKNGYAMNLQSETLTNIKRDAVKSFINQQQLAQTAQDLDPDLLGVFKRLNTRKWKELGTTPDQLLLTFAQTPDNLPTELHEVAQKAKQTIYATLEPVIKDQILKEIEQKDKEHKPINVIVDEIQHETKKLKTSTSLLSSYLFFSLTGRDIIFFGNGILCSALLLFLLSKKLPAKSILLT